MLLLLSHISRVQLCATPQTSAHQSPPSLGFSRQEHWSGLPFPSPVRERESESEVSQSCPTHGLQPTRPLRPWDFPGKSTGVGCHCLLQKQRDRYYQKMILKHSNKHLSSLPNNILYVFLILVHLNLENFPLDSFDEYAFKNYLFFRVSIF